jgi:hypothetical protein
MSKKFANSAAVKLSAKTDMFEAFNGTGVIVANVNF